MDTQRNADRQHSDANNPRPPSQAPQPRTALLFIFPHLQAGCWVWRVPIPGRRSGQPRQYETFRTAAEAVAFTEAFMLALHPDMEFVGLSSMFVPRPSPPNRQ